jgi:predicted nucleic acid-binding Zn ribbon protein
MRNRPITHEYDRHGDVVLREPTSSEDLAEILASERKDPRRTRLLAESPRKTGILGIVGLVAALLLVGCTLSVDPHAIEDCTITGAVNGGQPVDGVCEEACGGVDLRDNSSGPTCSSSARAAAFGSTDAATCHYITADDGSTGCCTVVGHSTDARVPVGSNGLIFYACDGSGS